MSRGGFGATGRQEWDALKPIRPGSASCNKMSSSTEAMGLYHCAAWYILLCGIFFSNRNCHIVKFSLNYKHIENNDLAIVFYCSNCLPQ